MAICYNQAVQQDFPVTLIMILLETSQANKFTRAIGFFNKTKQFDDTCRIFLQVFTVATKAFLDAGSRFTVT